MSAWCLASPTLQGCTAVAVMALLAAGLSGEGGLWRRTGGRIARWARIAAWTIAVLAAAALVLRPLGRQSEGTETAVLVTDADVSASAGTGTGTGPGAGDGAGAVFVLAGARAASTSSAEPSPATTSVVPDARTLWRRHPGLGSLRVQGHGLDAWDWAGFAGRLSFAPPPLPTGIADVGWSRRLLLGERLRVEGRVVGGAPGGGAPPLSAKVALEGPGGAEDERTLTVPAGGAPFVLYGLPRAPGRLLYRLRWTVERGAAGGVQSNGVKPGGDSGVQTLDVAVLEPTPVSVLVLEAAPRFESRFLKDWLSGAGARVAVRSVISKDRVRTESPAAGGSGLGRHLDPSTFDAFDAVVADPAALAALSAAERSALCGAVARGAGLVVQVQRSPATGAPDALPGECGTPPAWSRIPGLEVLSARLEWPGAATLPPLDVEARELGGDAPALARDTSGRRLAVTTPHGSGRVAWTVMHDTYRWVLEGNAAAHRAWWSQLLSAVARASHPASGRWLAPSGPILVDRPLAVTLDGVAGGEPAARLGDAGGASETLALRQDALDRGRFTATVWPRRAGWLWIESSGGAVLDLHAAPAAEWTTWRAAERQRATAERATAGPTTTATTAPSAARGPLPRWPFFALMLAGLAWLWGEERLRG